MFGTDDRDLNAKLRSINVILWTRGWQTMPVDQNQPPIFFVNKVVLNALMPSISCDCFCTTVAEMSSCQRDCMAHKA